MKGAEGSFSNTFEKIILSILSFKNRRKYKIGRCSWENCTTKRYSGSNESGGYNNFIGQIMRRLRQL